MSNEFMGKTYNFDPDNVLTQGLPVPPGWRPLGVAPAIQKGDLSLPACSQGDIDFFCEYQRIQGSCLYETDGVPTDGRVYFRRIEWDADLLARIPEGFEPYDRPGEPPTNTEGWKIVKTDEVIPARGRHFMFDVDWTGRKYAIEAYGDTWCLARPKQAAVTCGTCGGTGELDESVYGPTSHSPHTCPDCRGGGEVTCDTRMGEVAQRFPREGRVCVQCGKPQYGGAVGIGAQPLCAVCAVKQSVAAPERACLVCGGPTAHNVCEACAESALRAQGYTPDGFRPVHHPTREERDAAAIDRLGSIALLTVVERSFRENRGERLPSNEDPNWLIRVHPLRCKYGWRSGDEPDQPDERLRVQVQHEDEV